MGLLDGKNELAHYQGGETGTYQFTSLDDIIAQFQIAYVGEGKIISKIKRADIAFHAQRGLQELSFDTFKSIKAQEIKLPPSLQMVLPHDYVNYTKLSWVDSAGIKHPLYKTNSTSNPFSIRQNEDGSYDSSAGIISGFLINGNFEGSNNVLVNGSPDGNWLVSNIFSPVIDKQTGVFNKKFQFVHGAKEYDSVPGEFLTRKYRIYQRIDISSADEINIKVTAAAAAANGLTTQTGTIRVGVTTLDPATEVTTITSPVNPLSNLESIKESVYNLPQVGGALGSYVEFKSSTEETKTINIDVSAVSPNSYGNRNIYVFVYSEVGEYSAASDGDGNESKNIIDSIKVSAEVDAVKLQENEESTAWKNYKSLAPSENQNDDYIDDTYWPMDGSRYGLDPQHAQANGSFYIDDRLGKIHFSSNISGKTVILDYISDSLGSDGEMQVHKFAEEAMYKCIAYAILSTRANTPEYVIQRFKKERFASIRTAKLRLSSFKLEELTQILRGKSKQIKH